MLLEHGPELLDGSIGKSDLAALAFGLLLPLVGSYLLFEIASFSFSRRDNRFRWRWRNLFRRKALDLPLDRVAQVRREAVESGDSGYSYRLVVVLDDPALSV